MQFVIDAREAFHAQKTGKGQWTKGLVQELMKRGLPVEVIVDEDSSLNEVPSNAKIFPKGIRWHFRVASYLKSLSSDTVYISPTSFIVPTLVGKKVKTMTIVHDLIAFQNEPHTFKARFIERLLLQKVLNVSAAICTVSESTKKDLLQKFPKTDAAKITAIFAGPFEESLEPNVPDGRTILCAATLCPRKNQQRLIEAYAALPESLRSQYQLVLVGARGWQDQKIVDAAGSTQGVEWKSYVPDAEYLALLSTCTVFALPSLYEGFGMQILDALQRGNPVLTSSRGSLKEVAGSAALTVDPESVDAITEGLQNLLTNDQLRQELRAKGPVQAAQFSWKKTADLFLQASERLVY